VKEKILPQRRRLVHTPPDWVETGSIFFLTICCAQRGDNSLAKPDIFEVVVSATQHTIRAQKWWMHLLVAMPDHLHAIVSFSQQKPMDALVRDWKRFIAKTAHVGWQDGFFEHRLRSDESLDEITSYILMNPVRAGITKTPEDWPYCWIPCNEPAAR
jgi:REP element-mobilizing transposase RayT